MKMPTVAQILRACDLQDAFDAEFERGYQAFKKGIRLDKNASEGYYCGWHEAKENMGD